MLVLGSVHAALELGLAGLGTGCIAVYTLVVYVGRRVAGVYLAAQLLSSAVQIGVQFGAAEWPVIGGFTFGTLAFSWLLGEFVGARRAYHSEVEARLHLLETERDQATRIAVAEERTRIARELHDVVAHAVSVIVVQAEGAAYAIESDPAAARGAVRTIADTGRGAQAVRLAAELRPDVVLMDVRMPVLDGVEATRRIVDAESARVLVMTTFDLDEYVYSALRAGASGFLLKDTRPAELVSALRAVAHGDAVVSPSVTRRLLDRFVDAVRHDASVLEVLTEREREVLALIARGLSNGEIAGTLFLSEATVKTHVGRVLSKLNLRDRVQAVVLAYDTGLARPGA